MKKKVLVHNFKVLRMIIFLEKKECFRNSSGVMVQWMGVYSGFKYPKC